MSGILKGLTGRRRYASGGLGMSDPRIQIPERTAGAISEPTTASLAGPATGREYHPLANADYYTYGQKGGEHQFFTGNLPVAPLQPGSGLPPTPSGGSGGGGGGAGILGDLTQLAGAAKTTGQLLNSAGVDNAYTQAMQNPLGAAKDALGYAGANSALSSVGSGAAANSALADAGFGAGYTTPALNLGATGAGAGSSGAGGALGAAGAAGTGLGAGSTSALGATTFAEMSPSAAAAIDAAAAGTGSAGTGAASAGFSAYALPVAALIMGIMNTSGAINEFKEGKIELGNFAKQANYKGIADQLKGSVPDEIYQKLQAADQGTRDLAVRQIESFLNTGDWMHFKSNMPGGPHQAKRPQMARGGYEQGHPGVLAYASDPKFVGTVRGKGTGRSDEIPARLSDGEYVMDAETVAMLGDGSTDAGAKKLDQMRARLRSHKGKNLAKGKFSDNAKDPMEYIK